MPESEKLPSDDLVTSVIGSLQSVFQSVKSMADSGAAQVRHTMFPGGTGMNGVYGFTLKADLGKPSVSVEPFGNLHADEATGQPVVREFKEPVTEIAEDVAVFVVTIEMPGIGAGDVQVEIRDRTLIVTGVKGLRKYRKEIALPAACSTEIVSQACQDGVLDLRIAKL